MRRARLTPQTGRTVYSGACRALSAQEICERAKKRTPALRLRAPDREIAFTDGLLGPYSQNLARDCGDFILRRSDGVFAYQLAVVTDDARMGVTQVVRGRDLLESTPRQLYLYELLGFPPPEFYHIPLLLAAGLAGVWPNGSGIWILAPCESVALARKPWWAISPLWPGFCRTQNPFPPQS